MPEVQNVGATDYAQYQPSQYQYEDYTDGYNTQPQVYDESAAEIKNASKSRLGATLLTAAIIGGGFLWGGYALGKRGAKKELTELQNAADKYKDFIDKQAKELENEADKVLGKKFPIKSAKDFAKKVKEEIAKLRDALKGVKDDTKEATDKAADDAKKAADDVKKTAEDTPKND